MGGGFGSGNLHGAVAHGTQDKKQMTPFGTYPHEVVMIDGVFMAFSKKALESGLRFDKNCPSDFHFYDIILGFLAKELDLKVGVGDIMITHESSGLSSLDNLSWKRGERYFLDNYGK
jgi:nicotinic acid phosphoribosyltransferase